MANPYFRFKQFTIHQSDEVLKVSTEACLFGAWVAQVFKTERAVPPQVLDIGAGTGLLTLMLAQAIHCRIDAIEISEMAYEQAVANLTASPWHNRITMIHGDVLNHSGTYDFLICNPPFYENQLQSPHAHRNLARHHTGLQLPALINQCRKLLGAGGRIALLLPFYRKSELLQLAGLQPLYPHKLVNVAKRANDLPFRVMAIFGLEQLPMIDESNLVIYEEAHYSPAFSELLAPYYLSL